MASPLLAQYRKALADAGVTDDSDDFFVIKDFLGPLAEQNRDLFKQDPELEQQWRAIREADSPGTIGGIVNTAKSAFDRSVQAKNVLGDPDATDVQDIAEREQAIRGRTSSVPWEDWGKSTGGDAVRVFLRDPLEITANIVASGLAGSLPAMAGGLAGGAAGSLAGPVGGVLGAAAGTGAGSLAVEYGSKYLDVLREAGADLADPESILRVVSDPEIRARAQELGLRRGLPVAAFDAASYGLAGKFLKGVRTATTGQNIRRGLTEAAIQGGLGGAGEVAGALSAGERISPGAVFEEVIGELGPGATEVAGAAMRRRLSDPYAAPEQAAAQPGPPIEKIAAQGTAPSVAPLAPESIPAVPAATVRTNADIVTSVEAMTPEQKVARATQLSALPAPTPQEVTELELLRAEIPRETAIASPATMTPEAAPVAPAVVQPALQPEAIVAPVVQTEVQAPTPVEAPTVAPTRVINDEMPAAATQSGTVELVSNLGPAEFIQWVQTLPEGGMTGESYRVGIAAIGKPDEISVLKSALAKAGAEVSLAESTARTAPPEIRAAAIEAWSALANKRQFFSEAIQAAENTGSAAEAPEVVAAHAPIAAVAEPEALPNPIELPPVVPSTAEPIPTPAETMVATATPALPVPAEAALSLGRNVRQVEADIEAVGRELAGSPTEERKQQLRNDSIRLFEELERVASQPNQNPRDVAFRKAEQEAAQMPAEASRAQEFSTVIGRLQQQGAQVDVFARQFFAQGVRAEIDKQISTLQQRQSTASPSEKISIGREISRRQARLTEVEQAQGATFTPWHIALAVEDVQNASSANLVTLLHEATEALGQRLNPVMKGRIIRAIDRSVEKIRQRAAEASARTGVPLARETGPLDLLSESLAQELTAEGIPDATNLAQAIWRWIKDIYYRTAMSLQAAFGGEPSDERALDWFNNQLERVVGGDYDYRIAGILDRYAVPSMQERVTQQRQPGGTPHGVTDYFDPYLRRISQPSVLPYTTDGVDWNIQFQQVGAQKTSLGEEIPDVESAARIQAAALNRYIEEAERVRVASGTTLSWADWWSAVGTGEDPRVMVATLDGKLPGSGSAAIGGDRMNQYMNGLAAVDARELIENWQFSAHAKLAKANDAIVSASDEVIDAAKLVNRLEEDRRNSELHEATLQEKLKKQIDRFVSDNSQGYKIAEQKGELDAAVRQAEDLMDGEPIPESYQQVFKSILDGEIPVFSYMRSIAELDLPLSDLSQREVVKAIRDNAATNTYLGQLVRNRPLMTALATLARRNAGQMDEIHLGWLKAEQYRAISEELNGIRQASDVGLREMIAGMRDRVKGATLRDRIVRDYLKRRRAMNAARTQVGVAQVRAAHIDSALQPIADAVERAQQQGSEAPSEWTVDNGAVMIEMRLGEEGKWTRGQRTIRFNPDGSIADGDAILRSIDANNLWLKQNIAKKGGALWQSVDRQTGQLKMIDAKAKYAEAQSYKMDTFLGPLANRAKQMGGGGERVAQMLQFFDHIRFVNHAQVETNSAVWSKAWRDVQKATGIKDNGVFQQQVYDPINYYLNTNPGLDEAAALRIATRMAHARLPSVPSEKFNEAFGRLLKATKTGFEYLVGVADKNGAFVNDPTLKSGLRRAVAQGWLTSMRSVDGGLLLRVTTDMEKAGWGNAREQKRDSRGILRTTIVAPVTFRDLTAQETSNSEALNQRLTQLFTPGIIRDWLVPFINKGGVEVFKHGEEAIPQLTLQNAWAQAKGNVLAWIDAVGAEVGLGEPQELANKEETNPVADLRLSMLRQLDGLFGMESKIAAESNQTRSMFDPMGPKPHVMMDARVNDTLPAEHMDFSKLDRESSQMLLGEIAFHAAFGRNGVRMIQTLTDMNQKAGAAKSDYEGLRGTTKAVREAEAVTMGYKSYKELERTADRAADIKRFQETLEKQMSVGNQSGPFAEARAGMALTSFMAGQIADGPKVAFYNLLSLAQTPFATRSLGPKSLRAVTDGFVATAKTGLGSILEALNLHILHATQEELDIAQTLGGARNLPWDTTIADIGPGGRQSLGDKILVRPLSLLRFIQNKGIALPIQGQAKEFPRLALVPGLGVSNSVAQIAAVGGMTAYTKMLRRMISRGIEYLAAHKDDAQNPSFKFKAADLGMGRWDKGMFDWWSSKSVEFGLGTLEEIVRGAIPAASKGERMLTKDQVLRVAKMVATEINGDSSVSTMPSMLIDNPKMRAFFPLLRWPFWAMHKTHEGLRTIDGKRDYVSVMKGLGILAMWNLPIGLAFTFLLDKYDEDLMGKKSNLPPTGATAAIPFVGPVAEAILADRSIPDTLKGYAVRMARAGNIYGVASDFIAGLASPADAGSGRRIFSLDQRILVMSQLLNVQQAVTNAVGQDWTTTWASVWSPLMRALGGNAALQVLDLTNNIAGLDNAESRLVARQNASTWLRASASELDIPLRGGGSSTPTPQSVWTREMLMSAMANDRIGFMDAYRKAMEAARKAVASDSTIPLADREREAEKRVLSGWRGRDPLTVFAHRPTDAQMRQMFSIMDETGRQDVQDALRRYRQFTGLIAPSTQDTQARTMERRITRPQGLNPFRREMVGSF